MKKLTVIYDNMIEDKNRDSYLSAIKTNIDNLEVSPLNDYIYTKKLNTYLFNDNGILVLEPYRENFKPSIYEMFDDIPESDIEGIYTDKLSITAEAILMTLACHLNPSGKLVMILNQSNVLGKSLAKELIDMKANVMSFNSKAEEQNIDRALEMNPNVIITASGNENFKIDESKIKEPEIIIDLSEDIEGIKIDKVIRKVPTVQVLKERLRR